MENASKALIMAAGVLIGVMILTLAVYLFLTFGIQSQELHELITANQLTQYNAQYTVYSGRKDITIYQIVSVKNLAIENNNKYKDYSDYETSYKVEVWLDRKELTKQPVPVSDAELLEGVNGYANVNNITGELNHKFSCNSIEYHPNGKVKLIKFE